MLDPEDRGLKGCAVGHLGCMSRAGRSDGRALPERTLAALCGALLSQRVQLGAVGMRGSIQNFTRELLD